MEKRLIFEIIVLLGVILIGAIYISSQNINLNNIKSAPNTPPVSSVPSIPQECQQLCGAPYVPYPQPNYFVCSDFSYVFCQLVQGANPQRICRSVLVSCASFSLPHALNIYEEGDNWCFIEPQTLELIFCYPKNGETIPNINTIPQEAFQLFEDSYWWCDDGTYQQTQILPPNTHPLYSFLPYKLL